MSLQNNQVSQNTPIQKISLLGGQNKALQEDLKQLLRVIPITKVSMPLAVGRLSTTLKHRLSETDGVRVTASVSISVLLECSQNPDES